LIAGYSQNNVRGTHAACKRGVVDKIARNYELDLCKSNLLMFCCCRRRRRRNCV